MNEPIKNKEDIKIFKDIFNTNPTFAIVFVLTIVFILVVIHLLFQTCERLDKLEEHTKHDTVYINHIKFIPVKQVEYIKDKDIKKGTIKSIVTQTVLVRDTITMIIRDTVIKEDTIRWKAVAIRDYDTVNGYTITTNNELIRTKDGIAVNSKIDTFLLRMKIKHGFVNMKDKDYYFIKTDFKNASIYSDTVYIKREHNRKKRIGIGLQLGVAPYFNPKPSVFPYLGIGISYNLINF